MKKSFSVLFGLSLLLTAVAAARQAPPPAKPEAAKPEAAGAEAGKPAAKFDQAQALAELHKSIAGKENEPAGKVFMDIDVLQGVTAGQLLAIMEKGYSRALGVTCTHCHVAGNWESDEKKEKQAARGMIRMNTQINNEILPKIKGLDTDHKPLVNCTTCHRGHVRPALNLP
ncbi:MAG TPA: c-type cytochrome [Thermoanaerobaculia bacterium]|jgi:hypothetical protein|nr:c-type cytochrome [Thermoanaerobaculia bacterium]